MPDLSHLTHSIVELVQQSGLLPDGGPIYYETDTSRYLVEPWNGFSAALFVFIAVYWVIRLKGQYRRRGFLVAMLLLLFIGGVGGTIYHLFRNSQLFLVMDWLPILLITMSSSVFLFNAATGKWWAGLLLVIVLFGAQFANHLVIGPPNSINVGYAMMALMVLVPSISILVKTKFDRSLSFFLGFLSFGLALFGRVADHWGLLPMGTHFLWHIFGAFATHFMLNYIFLITPIQVRHPKTSAEAQ